MDCEKEIGTENSECECCSEYTACEARQENRIIAESEDRIVQVTYPPMIKNFFCEIFHDDFMREYTNFDSFETFQYSSAVFINWSADILCYREKVFDRFVQESTSFTSWDEMVQKASDLKMSQTTEESPVSPSE